MHHGGDVSAPAGAGDLPAVDRGVARAAARWLLRLSSGQATDADIRAYDQWRASKAEHEHAWQRAQRVNDRFGLIPPALGLAALNRPDLKSRRVALKTLAALIVVGPAGWAAWRASPLELTADYRSATGEQRQVLLSDGHTVLLNTSSAVDVMFDASTRLLRLRAGEIAVYAAPEAAAYSRPVVVRTRLGDIEAQTARFCVRQNDGTCRVSVQEGQVRMRSVSAPGGMLNLAVGEQAELTDAGLSQAVPADPHAADWTRGVLHASAWRLDAFLAELGRYRQGMLRCAPEVAHLRISGTFQLHDTDSVLAALPQTLPVQMRYRTAYWVMVGPRPAAQA